MDDFKIFWLSATILISTLILSITTYQTIETKEQYKFYSQQGTPAMEIACQYVSDTAIVQGNICMEYFKNNK